MKKLFTILLAVFGLFVGFSFAASNSIINPEYSINGDTVKIFRTNMEGGYMDINLREPTTKQRLHFGEVNMSDRVFTYTKQWEGDQEVQMIRGECPDNCRQFTISAEKGLVEADNSKASDNDGKNRTVIPVVPKTGPNGTLIGIILATLVIFGGYIYIRKRADI